MTAPPPFGRETIESILPHRPPFLLLDEVVELDPGARVVGLKDAFDVSFEEISSATGMPVGTAKCYAHRGRSNLRERLSA